MLQCLKIHFLESLNCYFSLRCFSQRTNNKATLMLALAYRVHNSQLWLVKLEDQWILTFMLLLLIIS